MDDSVEQDWWTEERRALYLGGMMHVQTGERILATLPWWHIRTRRRMKRQVRALRELLGAPPPPPPPSREALDNE
jgi:hypothetical protein